MIKIRSVWMKDVEGYGEEKLIRGPGALDKAQAQMRKWGSMGAPDPETGCYSKCDFVVTFEDGDTYTGRYDLQSNGLASGLTIGQQMKNFVGLIAGTFRPAWCSDEDWERICERHKDDKAEALEWLETYEVA